jgi:hypothetical protein
MGKQSGVEESKFEISGDRLGDRLLQGVERRIKSPNPIPIEKQMRIDRILAEMATHQTEWPKFFACLIALIEDYDREIQKIPC